jgi:hypothetical protein
MDVCGSARPAQGMPGEAMDWGGLEHLVPGAAECRDASRDDEGVMVVVRSPGLPNGGPPRLQEWAEFIRDPGLVDLEVIKGDEPLFGNAGPGNGRCIGDSPNIHDTAEGQEGDLLPGPVMLGEGKEFQLGQGCPGLRSTTLPVPLFHGPDQEPVHRGNCGWEETDFLKHTHPGQKDPARGWLPTSPCHPGKVCLQLEVQGGGRVRFPGQEGQLGQVRGEGGNLPCPDGCRIRAGAKLGLQCTPDSLDGAPQLGWRGHSGALRCESL